MLPNRTNKGLTLMELVVVLMVLVALAGILVPVLTGFVERSHSASAATGIGELNKALELYNVKYLNGYPDSYDSLEDSVSAADKFYSKLSGHTGTDTVKLLDHHIASLKNAGITSVNIHYTAATFPTGANATEALATQNHLLAPDDFLVRLDPLTILNQIPSADTTQFDYLCLGVGATNKAIGKTMQEAPLHFEKDPTAFYQRFIAVYEVDKTVTERNARLVGVLGSEFTGVGAHLNEYHKAQ